MPGALRGAAELISSVRSQSGTRGTPLSCWYQAREQERHQHASRKVLLTYLPTYLPTYLLAYLLTLPTYLLTALLLTLAVRCLLPLPSLGCEAAAQRAGEHVQQQQPAEEEA